MLGRFVRNKAKANSDGFVDSSHSIIIRCRNVAVQPCSVHGPNLLQHDHGFLREFQLGWQEDMGGLFYLFDLAADRSDDNSGAVIVTYIVLDYEDRPEPVLLTTDDR